MTRVVLTLEMLIVALGLGLTRAPTEGSSGGGLWLYRGTYYVPGVGHVDYPLGKQVDGLGGGPRGFVAHSDYNGTLHEPDVGLVALGTHGFPALVDVYHGRTKAPVERYDTGNGDLPAGTALCESGHARATQRDHGYRCGTLIQACTRSSIYCIFANPDGIVASGDSGGLVWSDAGSGVEIAGWVSTGYLDSRYPRLPNGSYTAGTFTPPWQIADFHWTAAQSWQGVSGGGPFPAGNDGTGCFVTVAGCQSE